MVTDAERANPEHPSLYTTLESFVKEFDGTNDSVRSRELLDPLGTLLLLVDDAHDFPIEFCQVADHRITYPNSKLLKILRCLMGRCQTSDVVALFAAETFFNT